MKKLKDKNANYNFAEQNQPKQRIGNGSYANLPNNPISVDFGPPAYRDGIINSFTAALKNVSHIDENGCHYGND